MHHLLFQPIDHHARQQPERIAFRCGSEALSYAAFARRTNQLANLLIERGVERGERVGIYLNRCLESAVAVHGILKAGAAYVPLDPEAPADRTRRLIRDGDIRCLITAPALRRKLPGLVNEAGPLEWLVGYAAADLEGVPWTALEAESDAPPQLRILGDDLAYIMYTSGTTGEPKGIMHTHRSGLAYARLSAQLYGVRPDDVIGNHCALHYDISTFGYFTAPLTGATTVIISDAHTKFPTSLLQLIEAEKITIWYSVPLALLQLLRSPTLSERDLTALRWILFGGEVFAPRHLRDFMRHAPGARASNVYGPAEVNQCTFYHLYAPPETDAPLPLGWVWPDSEALVVDAHDRPVATGEIGQLLIRSATMMKAYWKQPELTERSFYHRERIPGNRETFYRTGDLVVSDSAGRLHFMGRMDRQVKVRGHRVELEETEAALAALPGVHEAAVYARSIGDNELTVEALVVPDPGAPATPDGWSAQLAKLLPPQGLPTAIKVVEALPRNDAGKIDRLAIRAATQRIIA
ncbi:amino acid adenylation domain-containing protein [Lewinella marina]|uniref:Amino acid adenylation domain-containing protein n=1 Tax=Neolewinella marina TaxID=438751 RepID=A0A2G0CDL5_9BACT|nr:amino acid adenylation domain-containing protein [Neolewinella marina]NJB85987.1 amino acid adenylation domain-containing protein [Neolewinella marina]PHK98045.1 hypothetical protein CGL56_12705 [Neolewinella marina]